MEGVKFPKKKKNPQNDANFDVENVENVNPNNSESDDTVERTTMRLLLKTQYSLTIYRK